MEEWIFGHGQEEEKEEEELGPGAVRCGAGRRFSGIPNSGVAFRSCGKTNRRRKELVDDWSFC